MVVALSGVLTSSSLSDTSVALRFASLVSEVGAVGDVGAGDMLELDGVVTSLVAAGERVVAGERILLELRPGHRGLDNARQDGIRGGVVPQVRRATR